MTLRVIEFQKQQKSETQPQGPNPKLLQLIAELQAYVEKGELLSLAVAGTLTGKGRVLTSFVLDDENPDAFRLSGALNACNLRVMDEAVDFGGEK